MAVKVCSTWQSVKRQILEEDIGPHVRGEANSTVGICAVFCLTLLMTVEVEDEYAALYGHIDGDETIECYCLDRPCGNLLSFARLIIVEIGIPAIVRWVKQEGVCSLVIGPRLVTPENAKFPL